MLTDQRIPHVSGVERAPCDGWDWDAVRVRCVREARRVLGVTGDVEGAAQEALLRAWRTRGSCRTPAQPAGWIATIARNEALRWLQRDRQPALELLTEPALDVDPPDERIASRVDLARAMNALRPQDRDVVRLRYEEDLTERAIAERLGLAEGTVKVRLHRARRRLRTELGDPHAPG